MVVHLDPRVLGRAARPGRRSVGAPWSRALVTSSETPSSARLGQVAAARARDGVDDPPTRLLSTARPGTQRERRPVSDTMNPMLCRGMHLTDMTFPDTAVGETIDTSERFRGAVFAASECDRA